MRENQIQHYPPHRAAATPRSSKRQQYTLVACEKCKRRKVKCSGETPCRQCVKRNGALCVYDRLTPKNSTGSAPLQTSAALTREVSSVDHVARPHPLWPLSRVEAKDLLETLRGDIETLSPFIDFQEIRSLVEIIFQYHRQLRTPGSDIQTARWDDLDDARNLDLLKVLLACSLSMRRNWKDDPSERFLSTVEENHSKRMRCVDVDIKDVAIATILSVYDYRRDSVTPAWRKISIAAKLCLELGLHRVSNPVLEDSTRVHLSWETKMFWCVYVLDRRYSFMANLPFTLQDRDIDFELLQADRSAPYLIPMVMYGRLGGKIIPTAPKFGSTHDELNENVREDLGKEIDRWMETTAIKTSSSQSLGSTYQNFSLRRQRQFNIFFEIRGNQMRLSLYKHSLYTPNSVLKHQDFARRAVQVAMDNIRVLRETRDSASDIYESLKPQYNFFLTSSLVSLHLAIRNAPQQFSSNLLEYSAGLNMLKSVSASSVASEKLSRNVQTLENALTDLMLGSMHFWGNSLPPKLSNCISPISMANSPPNGTLTEAPERIDLNSKQPKRSSPLPPEMSVMPPTATMLPSCSFKPGSNMKILTYEEERGQNVLQGSFMDDFGVNNFWNMSTEMFWDEGAIAGGEFGGMSFQI